MQIGTRRQVRAFAAAAAWIIPIIAAPAMAQTSSSTATVYDYLTSSYRCQQAMGPTAGASVATCAATPVTGGTASPQSSSTNSLRRVTAYTAQTSNGNSTQESYSVGYSVQNSSIFVTGTPGATDNVVFHFLTPILQGSAAGLSGNLATNSFWQLSLAAAGSGATTVEYRQFYGNGTSGPTAYGSRTSATSGGVDFTVPFSAFGNTSTLDYSFAAYVNAGNYNGGTASAWISANLSGVDVVDATGQRVASASFNADGTGTLALQSSTTTPEPSSIGLLGTGFVSLFTFGRRRRRRRTA